ncbi:serine protease [Jannaschia sp. Os4]|uniref:serine protease n=1 Tax=Jannaschia sp. Os4 TaxID=2807617 RepID=UPI001EED6BEA|nr:serine protease [Jannaschia sp. Os4]
MRIVRSAAVAAAMMVGVAQGAAAQEFWVQIEAHPTLRETEERARAYGDLLPDVNAFTQPGLWSVLTLGPYDGEGEAQAILRQLRRQGLVPRDSFVSRGRTYRERIWPAPGAVAEAAPDGEAGAAVAAAEQAPAPDAAPRVDTTPPEPVEETPREARRSEAGLDRAAREELQRALQWFGLYAARIDGAFGPGTRNSMAAWQAREGVPTTGVLTTRQRADLLARFEAARARIGLGPLVVREAGIELVAPRGLVTFDRIEAPFVHHAEKNGSGVTLSLISQPGGARAMGGLYQILQTVEAVPEAGARELRRDGFTIEGAAGGRTTRVEARLQGDHLVGFMMSWPAAEDGMAARVVPEMVASLASVGAPLDPEAGFDPAAQDVDMVSGLEVRRPARVGAGFWVDRSGAVATAAANVAECGRVTLDGVHEAEVATLAGDLAVLRPVGRLAPPAVARLAPAEARLKTGVAVGGYPFGGVLGTATLTFGTLEDVRGLDGSADVLRLGLAARAGDVGGPVLDEAGRVAGLLLPAPEMEGRALPGDVAVALKSGRLETALSAAGVSATMADGPAPAPVAPEDLTRVAAEVTVLVGCWEG